MNYDIQYAAYKGTGSGYNGEATNRIESQGAAERKQDRADARQKALEDRKRPKKETERLSSDMHPWVQAILNGKRSVNDAQQQVSNRASSSISTTSNTTPSSPFNADNGKSKSTEPKQLPDSPNIDLQYLLKCLIGGETKWIEDSGNPFSVSITEGLATVGTGQIYDKLDYKTTVSLTNSSPYGVSAGDFIYIEASYTDNTLGTIAIQVGADPGAEIELEDTMDDPPVTQQTKWRYLIAKIISSGDALAAVQICTSHLRILDRFFMNTMVDYPIAL